MSATVVTELGSMNAQIVRALRNQEFLLHYQPKVDVASGAITGAEALLRWRSPSRGVLLPRDFLPALEHSGSSETVARWVLKSVCAQLRLWLDAGIEPVPISVNLSASQLHKGLDTYIGDVLGAYKLDASLLEVEASENVLRRDIDEATASLLFVKALGIKLLLDDFGTCSSSLRALRTFPLDGIKLDCTLLGETEIHPDGATIFQAVLDLARQLKLHVVVEGVETQAQWNFVRSHGCAEAQGYLLAKPMAAETFTNLLAERCGLHRSRVALTA